VTADLVAAKIDEVKKKTGKLPKLLMMDHSTTHMGTSTTYTASAK
jgi:hypothetical protein